LVEKQLVKVRAHAKLMTDSALSKVEELAIKERQLVEANSTVVELRKGQNQQLAGAETRAQELDAVRKQLANLQVELTAAKEHSADLRATVDELDGVEKKLVAAEKSRSEVVDIKQQVTEAENEIAALTQRLGDERDEAKQAKADHSRELRQVQQQVEEQLSCDEVPRLSHSVI
jgi:DNA repair exonuclease SbcCD ATPase subunit